jgi:hypothetical protein
LPFLSSVRSTLNLASGMFINRHVNILMIDTQITE